MERDLNTKLMKAWTAWRLMLAAMIASFTVGSALAEESDSEASSEFFEEVLVTAERVESNILDTPMTITALNSDMLQQLGVQDRVEHRVGEGEGRAPLNRRVHLDCAHVARRGHGEAGQRAQLFAAQQVERLQAAVLELLDGHSSRYPQSVRLPS